MANQTNYSSFNYRQQRNYMFDALLVFALLMYLSSPYWFGNGALRLSFSLMMGFIIWFAVLDRQQKNKQTLSLMVIVFFIELLLPIVLYQIGDLINNKWVYYYLANPQIIMPWFWFLILMSRDSGGIISKVLRIASVFYLVYMFVGLLFPVAFNYEDLSVYITEEQIGAANKHFKDFYAWWKDLILNFDQIIKQGKAYYIGRLNYATGGYYLGTVDENQHETLGVFLKDIKPADQEFYSDATVIVWGLLQAKTMEDGLSVDMSCYHGRKRDGEFNEDNKGKVYPDPIPLIFDEELIDIDCRFDQGNSMEEGSNKVSLVADFHYETLAYLKVYFMDKDRIRSMESQGLDPLGEYGITDTNPKARYTNGPVRIGMGSAESPIGLSDAFSVNPRLGVTLETNTNWKGLIKQVEELLIMVPDSMSLDTAVCPEFNEVKPEEYLDQCVAQYKKYRSKQLIDCVDTVNREKATRIEKENIAQDSFVENLDSDVVACMKAYCEQELVDYKIYNLTINNANKHNYANFGYDSTERPYKTFSCRVNLDSPVKIMGGAPVSAQYFRAKARYTYRVSEDTSVQIVEKDSTREETRPKPPSSIKASEQMGYIMTEYYKKDPFIKDACVESGVLGDVDKCSCLTGAIMARESNGNVEVKDGDGGQSKYIMQIKESTAKEVWDKYQLDPCNLYEAKCNIRSAVFYLKSLENNADGEPKHLAAGYNGGSDALESSKDCAGKKKWECTINPGLLEATRTVYVPFVMERYDACMEMDLVQKAANITPTGEEAVWEQGSFELDFYKEYNVLVQRLKDTLYYVKVRKNDDKYSVTVYLGKETDENEVRLTNAIELWAGASHDPDFPFITFSLNGNTLEYKYMKKSVSAPITLIDDKKKMVSGTEVKDQTAVFKDWIYAYYEDDEIKLYDKSQTNVFCNSDWSTYTGRATGTCEEDKLYMIEIHNIETYIPESSLSERVGSAKVQIIFDLEKEHDCCSDCTNCNKISSTGLSCSSCKECTTNWGTFFTTCETKKEATDDCCETCSCTDPEICDDCNGCLYDNTCRAETTETIACCNDCTCDEETRCNNCIECGWYNSSPVNQYCRAEDKTSGDCCDDCSCADWETCAACSDCVAHPSTDSCTTAPTECCDDCSCDDSADCKTCTGCEWYEENEFIWYCRDTPEPVEEPFA